MTLPATLRDGIPVSGSRLGFDHMPDGTLYAIGGSRFEDVLSVGDLALNTPDDAATLAAYGIAQTTNATPVPVAMLSARRLAELREQATLALASTGNGADFRFVWNTVPVPLEDGGSMLTAVDGLNGDLLAAWDPVVYSSPPCEPESQDDDPARLKPQNGSLGYTFHYTICTPAPSLATYWNDATLTHELHYPYITGGYLPEIMAYGWHESSDGCIDDDEETHNWVPVPGRTYNGYHTFENFLALSPKVYGKSAGDAFYKSLQMLGAMYIVHAGTPAPFSWDFFRGSDPLYIYINWDPNDGVADNAYFNPTYDEYYGPAGTLGVVENSSQTYMLSASLDVVAHELGHGLIFDTAGWSRSTSDEREWHEGFADVIGHMTEWIKEASGNGYERADWLYDEDSRSPFGSSYARRLDDDDGEYNYQTGTGPYAYHEQDSTPSDPTGHYNGLPIAVAFRLSVVGGTNPVCSEGYASNWDGCDVDVTEFDNTWAAYKTWIRALAVYGDDFEDWDDISDYMRQAAHDLYWQDGTTYPPQCTDGVYQQLSVTEAFNAIGYPGSGEFVCTCQEDCTVVEE